MKKENVSYGVMYIKKGLRMIRLCHLQYENTMQIAAQQTIVLLCSGTAYMRILQGILWQKAPNPM